VALAAVLMLARPRLGPLSVPAKVLLVLLALVPSALAYRYRTAGARGVAAGTPLAHMGAALGSPWSRACCS
jgi:hypothetical protein